MFVFEFVEEVWKWNDLDEQPGDWVHKQFWNGKSQNPSDFLQTPVGYARKEWWSKA